jgi:hypothetical protein
MKEFKVYLTAFGKKDEQPKVRVVKLPIRTAMRKEKNQVLNMIFSYGQNDIQPVNDCYSVSVGDIIEYEDELYLVSGAGFIKKGEKDEAQDEFLKLFFKLHEIHPFLEENFGYLFNK